MGALAAEANVMRTRASDYHMTNYSARLRHVALVEGGRPSRRPLVDETIVIFRASTPRAAFRRALALGRQSEHEYKNARGKRVRWAFVAVLTLDALPHSLDGTEVWSTLRPRQLPRAVSFSSRFRPESSSPTESAPAGRLAPKGPRRRGAA
jgi:hypothetical protein